MKLHLPKQLFTALIAALTLATPATLTLGSAAWGEEGQSPTISVNIKGTKEDISADASGTLGGISASGWQNVECTGGTYYLTDQNNISAGVLQLSGTIGGWQSNDQSAATLATLAGQVQKGYLDVRNTGENHYNITILHDYWFYDATFYLSGDDAGESSSFAPIQVNGKAYIGGTNVLANETNREWSTGNADGSSEFTEANTIKVTNLSGDLTATNVWVDSNSRATLAGLQLTDVTDSKVYAATLGSDAAALSDVSWSKQGVETSSTLEDISESERYLSVTADAAGSTLNVAADTTIAGLQLAANNLTVGGSGTLTVGALHAKEGTTLTMNTALAGTSLVLTGCGSISLNDFTYTGEVSVLSSTTLNLAGGTDGAQKVHSIGTLSAAAGTVALGEYSTLSLGDGVTESTHSIGTLSTGTGAHVQINSNATLNTLNFATGSTATLSGGGIYKLAAGTTDLTTGVTLGEDWKGAVLVSDYESDRTVSLDDITDSKTKDEVYKLGNKVGLSNVVAWLGRNSIDNNLLLVKPQDGAAALSLNNGSSSATGTFAGTISGDGDIRFTWTGGNTESAPIGHKFTGNTSDWDGWFISGSENTGKRVAVYFTSSGSVFSVEGNGGVKDDHTSGSSKLEVVVGDSSADVTTDITFNGSIVNAKQLDVYDRVTFKNGVAATTVNVNSGSSMTLQGALTSSTVSLADYTAALVFDNSSEVTANASMTGAGSVEKKGAGILNLGSASGALTGNITVTAGTLKAGSEQTTAYFGADYGSNKTRTITVKNGAALDVNGTEAYYHVVLEGGATLKNSSSTDISTGWKALPYLELTGDATVEATSQIAMHQGDGDKNKGGTYKLELGGHTLTKTGADNMYLHGSISIGAGTIKINDGTFQMASGVTLESGVNLTLNGGSLNSSAAADFAALTVSSTTGTFEISQAMQVTGGTTLSGGTLTKAGTGVLTLNGGITGCGSIVGAGSTVIGAGNELSGTTISITNVEVGGTLINAAELTLNGVVNITSQELLTATGTGSYGSDDSGNGFYNGSYYVIQTKENTEAKLTLGDTFELHLIGSALSSSSADGGSYWSKDASGNLIITTTGSSGTYFVNKNTVTVGGSSATTGVGEASAFHVASGATLQLQGNPSDSFTAGQALITTTGEGNITLGSDASIAASSVSHATGKLTINNGARLTMDDGTKTDVYDLSSFTSVELDDGTIQYRGDGTTLNNVTVTANGGHITFRDMNNIENGMVLTGTTTLNGTLTLDTLSNVEASPITSWKYGVNIAKLTGTGTLDIKSTNSPDNTNETAKVSIQELSAFTGNILLSKYIGPAQLNLNNLSGTLGLQTIAMSGGAQTTLSVNADEEATMATVISGDGSVTKQGAGKLTLSGVSSYTGATTVSAGELALAADASLGSGAVTVASGTTLSMGDTTGAAETTYTISTLNAGSGSVTLADKATLTLSSGTSSIGTLTGGTDSKINLAADATLNSLSSVSGSVTLTGSGTYSINRGDATNMAVGEGWTGLVELFGQGSRTSYAALDLTNYGRSGSTISLKEYVGYFLNNDGSSTKDIDAHLILSNTTLAAIELMDGYNGCTYNFNGTISGEGNFIVNSDLGTNNSMTFNFTGDTSEWTGQMVVTDGEHNVKYSGSTTIANSEILARSGNDGVMNLTIEHSSDAVTVSSSITGNDTSNTVNLTTNAAEGVSFSNNVAVARLAVANGTTAKINADDKTITAGKVTISQKEATLSNVTVQGSSIAATSATDGAKGSISNANVALAQLQEDASFTIQDMTLTNTTITAATVETKVNLQNVEGSTALLAQGAFTLNATPTVGVAPSGETHGTLSYSNGLAIATDTNASLTLNLDVVNAVAGDAHGTYDLTITLSGFGDTFAVTEDIRSMVGFDSTSWLGQALVSQNAEYSVVTEQTPATAAEGGVPTVSYAAGTGSNVGSLVITIAGLNVPEPATSTLSLLALAALAARRRRK